MAAVLLATATALAGEPHRTLGAAVGALALWGFHRLLKAIYPEGIGWGDVKLAGVLGRAAGWLGWANVVVGACAGLLIGGVGGVLLLVIGTAGLKTRAPYGPYMMVGMWVGIALGNDLADAYLRLSDLR